MAAPLALRSLARSPGCVQSQLSPCTSHGPGQRVSQGTLPQPTPMPRTQTRRVAGRRDNLATSPGLGNRSLGVWVSGDLPAPPILFQNTGGLGWTVSSFPPLRGRPLEPSAPAASPSPPSFASLVGGGLGPAGKPTAVPLCLSFKRPGLGPKGKDVPTSIKAASPRPARGGGRLWGTRRCPQTVGGGAKALRPEQRLGPLGTGGRPLPGSQVAPTPPTQAGRAPGAGATWSKGVRLHRAPVNERGAEEGGRGWRRT